MPDLIHLAIPAFIVLLVAEAAFSARDQRDLYDAEDTAGSLAMGLGNVAVNLLAKGWVYLAFLGAYQFRLFEIGYTWWAWVMLFFLEDLTYYWFHRVSHETRFFWASHVVHHSSQKYNLGTALRQTWTGPFVSFVFWLWLPFIGFPPPMIMTVMAISLIYQFWIHTETIRTLGPLEWVMNTPSHHRVHHASNIEYLDRNHAGVLIIWDRMFGTFVKETIPPVYGLTKNIDTHNPIRIAFHEWIDMLRDMRHAPGWKTRVKIPFMPPGWKP